MANSKIAAGKAGATWLSASTAMRLSRSSFSICLLVLASCNPPPPQPSPRPPVNFVWDLSQTNRIEQVGWPAAIKGDVWIIDGPGTIRLKVRGGLERDVKIHTAIVGRESARVRNVRLILEKGTIDSVYADAMKLAADWQFTDTKDIQVFKDTQASKVKNGGDGVYQFNDYEAPQPKSIEIRQSFDSASGKPFLTILAMGFKQDFDATTQPSP